MHAINYWIINKLINFASPPGVRSTVFNQMAMSMSSNVQVPADFGIEYLGSPVHSNLKFLLDNGEEVLANSVIMSLNSPVIKRITTEFFQDSIEVREFSKDAVKCFVEASYSGVLKNVSRMNFRCLNKMAHEFEIYWLMDKCFEYFTELTEAVKEDNFDDQLYIFDEAMFILDKLKKTSFIDVVVKKLKSCGKYFATGYLSDVSLCTRKNLEKVVEMVEEQEHILLEILVEHFENNKNLIDENCRYILEKLQFTDHQLAKYRPLYERLLEKLKAIENPSTADFRLIIQIVQQIYKPSCTGHFQYAVSHHKDMESRQIDATQIESRLVKSRQIESTQIESRQTSAVQTARFATIPNDSLLQEFEQMRGIETVNELSGFLKNSPKVSNSYIFFDALCTWLRDLANHAIIPTQELTLSVQIFAHHLSKSKWKPLAREYVERCHGSGLHMELLRREVLQNPRLVTNDQYDCIRSLTDYTAWELFGRNHDITFRFRQEANTDCIRKGDCGFILAVTAAVGQSDNSFKIQLVTDPDEYPEDVHFHRESVIATNIHFSLEMIPTHVNDDYMATGVRSVYDNALFPILYNDQLSTSLFRPIVYYIK